MYKILIIEDDHIISSSIKKNIRSWGWEVDCITDFREVMTKFVSFNPQLVLMDVSLPFYNGFHWCGEIRKVSKVPIIFLSSASDNMDIVMAMNMGGDDYITKPFDLNVLIAKIQAILRRTYEFGQTSELLSCGELILNLNNQTAVYHEQKIELTKNEFKILQVLMESRGKVVSRETIMTYLWETDSFIDDNTLTVNMTRLRKKLEEIGLLDFITTKRGTGYLVE